MGRPACPVDFLCSPLATVILAVLSDAFVRCACFPPFAPRYVYVCVKRSSEFLEYLWMLWAEVCVCVCEKELRISGISVDVVGRGMCMRV